MRTWKIKGTEGFDFDQFVHFLIPPSPLIFTECGRLDELVRRLGLHTERLVDQIKL
jgi:hypothetical protein